MVKHENFKTCEQSGFCKRNRALADTVTSKGASWTSPYRLDPDSVSLKNGRLKGVISKTLEGGEEAVRLPLVITFHESGSVRVTVDEEKRQKGAIELRHGSPARKERYNEVDNWILVGGLNTNKATTANVEQDATRVLYGPGNQYEAIIKHSPFGIEFIKDDQVHVKFNERGFMNMEHWRPKVEMVQEEQGEQKEGEEQSTGEHSNTEPDADESTWWEESFGGNTDSKPKGPESIGLDITFPGYSNVYGIPGHTGPLSLKETR